MSKVFLGGTCNNTTWRDQIIPLLSIPYFNPVVEDWTEECQAIEIDEKENKCDIHLYVITKDMQGVFSIAEAVHSAHTNAKTVFQIIPEGFEDHELKSLQATAELIDSIGGISIISSSVRTSAAVVNYMTSTNLEL